MPTVAVMEHRRASWMARNRADKRGGDHHSHRSTGLHPTTATMKGFIFSLYQRDA